MIDDKTTQLAVLLALPLVYLMPALLAVLVITKCSRDVVGKVIDAERPGRALRLAVSIGPQITVTSGRLLI